MPPRTTAFQAIVHLVRRHTAEPGVIVTESKMLYDPVLEMEREVDIVVEGMFDGDSVVTSIEVIEHRRPADIVWVEQMIAKHRHLPTNRLILISKSGFSRTALKAVAFQGGAVEALTPKFVPTETTELLARLVGEAIQLTPRRCQLKFVDSDGGEHVEFVEIDRPVYNGEGLQIGLVRQLATEAMDIPWMIEWIRDLREEVREKDVANRFSCSIGVGSLGYFLHGPAQGGRYKRFLIYGLDIDGDFKFQRIEFESEIAELAARRYAAGQGEILGRRGVWVRTFNQATREGHLSWRFLDRSNDRDMGLLLRNFPGLSGLEAPKEWKERAPRRLETPSGC